MIFKQELIVLQEEHGGGLIEIPLSQLQHQTDHSKVDHFNISLVNDDNRAYEGRLTVIADFLITNRHPDMPGNLQEISESYLQ